jgi:nicotinamide phosphoribosyltransferase
MYADTSFDLFAPTVTDGYKVGHRPLYPYGTNFAYSNGTFRSDRIFINDKSKSRFWDGKVVWVGIQGALREINGLWKRSFFDKPKDVVCKRYARRMNAYLGQGMVNVECFEKLHDLGYLPIEVLSIKEGSRVDMNVPVYTVYNTVPEFFWVVNYLETLMSALIWKITTNATIAYEYRRTLEYWAKETGVDMSYVDIQGHDFAFRGLSGPEDAARVGLGHLVVFKGTDTLPAIDYAEDMYFANVEKEFVACSVVATEHAVATSNILFNVSKMVKEIIAKCGDVAIDTAELRAAGELEFIKEVLTVKHQQGIVSLVSDSFDFWRVLTEIAPALKQEIISRQPDANGFAKTVFRPDSGDPVKIICGSAFEIDTISQETLAYASKQGYEYVYCVTDSGYYHKIVVDTADGFSHPIYHTEVIEETPEMKGAVQCLFETFGGTTNDSGFITLHERVSLIYGDSITVQRADEILRRLAKKKFASNNIVFGIGSYTYQHNSRDTHGFAVKSTVVRVEDNIIELFKAPKTEKDTLKKSAKGFLKVVKDEKGNFVLEQEQEINVDDVAEASGELKRIFRNSEFTCTTTLSEITKELLGA